MTLPISDKQIIPFDKILLEVGVSDGFHTERYLEKYKLPVVGFEPVPYLYPLLNKKFKNYKNVMIYEAAVDVKDAVRNFHISDPQTKTEDKPVHPYGCSSLYQFPKDINDKWTGRTDFNMIETIKVNTVNLENFFRQRMFNGIIEYLHCDAQGNDINVLRSLGPYLNRVRAGEIECAAKTELYEGTNNRWEVAYDFLNRNGFNCSGGQKKYHEATIKFWR